MIIKVNQNKIAKIKELLEVEYLLTAVVEKQLAMGLIRESEVKENLKAFDELASEYMEQK